jgi:glycosyltransferase involved in cell wall biosynthesis
LKKPELTIGVSFYNTADTLVDLAKCIFAQTFTNWEWILIDDGSTDGGYDIVRAIKDPRVRIIRDEVNKGRPYRYNYITDIARGDFIARFDADDMCHPMRFQKQVEFLRAHPHVDVVSTGMLTLGPLDVPLGVRIPKAITHEEICRDPFAGIRMSHPIIMGRKRWFQKYPYSERYSDVCEDYALFASSWKDSCFANIPEALYFYRAYESFSVGKYCRSQCSCARANWEYGRATHGATKAAKAVIARYLRIGVCLGCAMVNLQDCIISHHSDCVTNIDRERFSEALAVIRKTEVPGIRA